MTPRRRSAFRYGLACASAVVLALPAAAEDLLQMYQAAVASDPALAAAQSNWTALQEKVPIARSALLPNVGLSAAANANDARTQLRGGNGSVTASTYGNANYVISASQPLYRKPDSVALDQAEQIVAAAEYQLAAAKQDLIVRVAQAYFDVLLAQYSIELANAQKRAVGEQLEQARRNFDVGVATITDTNEAEARHDAIAAQEIAARNELETKRAALRVIIGRAPGELRRLGGGFEPALPEPAKIDWWQNRALVDNPAVRVAAYNREVATLEIDKQKAARLPTIDLVASAGQNFGTGAVGTNLDIAGHTALIGVQLNVPIYLGGLIDARVRESTALAETARQNLEAARRAAMFNAQTGYVGMVSAAASIKGYEQAVKSSELALRSNITGQEVGIRTNLDVLNVTQTVFQNKRDLANAYMSYLLALLKLKASAGTLTDDDVKDLNRRLAG